MTAYDEYPQQRYMLKSATVRRAVLLPGDVRGTLLARDGQPVEMTNVVARGQLPSRHHIVEAAAELRLRNPDDLNALLQVERGERVQAGQVLAGKNKRRGPKSPVDGIVVGMGEGRIIVQELPIEIDLEAGIRGFVVDVRPRRGVMIQTAGAVMQGVWGNGRRAIGALRFEPDDGLELMAGDDIGLVWRGAIVISKRPLSELGMRVMEAQDIAGVIAPSMDSTLIDAARNFDRAILLTEGFGTMRLSIAVQTFLQEMIESTPNIRGTLDAVTPDALNPRRPELLVSLAYREGAEPRPPRTVDRLRVGMPIRITTHPYTGQSATITDIPSAPVQLDGGLRVPAAYVQLTGGEVVAVPIANLEVFAG